MRTSLLRFALSLSVFILAVTTAAHVAIAGQLAWTVTTTRADVTVTSTPDGDRVAARGDDYQYVSAPGAPVMPFRIVSLLLSPGETVVDLDVDAGTEAVVASRVTPVVAPAAEGAVASSASLVAGGEQPYPAEHAVFLGVGHMRGFTIASFAVYPVRVRGGNLLVNETITLRVTTGPDESGMRIAQPQRARKDSREDAERILRDLVVNPEAAASYPMAGAPAKKRAGGFQPTALPSLEGSDVDYVIITNDSLAATFTELADWKTAKGVPTVVRTTEWIDAHYKHGADPAETIRSFIIDAYQDWGIKYVLLGGDTDLIPVRLGRSVYLGVKELPVDMYFGCLDGDWNFDHDEYFGENGDQMDLYPEVYCGRLPAVNNETAILLVGKIVSYETPLDYSYTGSALLLAEVLFPIDWTSGQPVTQDGADIANFLYLLAFDDPSQTVTRLYENYGPHPGALPENVPSVIAAMNSGYDQVNHTGHGFRFNMSVGQASIGNADADALTNGTRLSNLFLLNCTAVAFTYYCIGEHFLLNPNGGAVSVLGAAESLYPLVAQTYMNEYYELLYVDKVQHVGEAFARSKLPRTPLAMQNDNADLWTHYVYNMLADPEMEVWTAAVQPLTVSYPPSIGIGTTPVTVHVADASGAVAGATVCLSKGEEDYEVGTTDASGNVTLSLTAESAGGVRVVATALNHGRFDAFMSVSPLAAAYVSFNGEAVDDDALGGTNGNGDGVIDAGETVDLTAQVKNTGGLAAPNVTLTLRATQAGVTVVDSTANVGNVEPGGTVAATDPFRVVLSPSIADKTPVKFTLVVRKNGVPTWTDRFTRLAHAPEIEFAVLRVNDAGTGNGDGIVQANELFRLHYRIKNFGTGAGRALGASLIDVSNSFSFFDSTDAYGDLPSIGSAENAGGFLLREPDVSTAHNLRIDVTDASGRVWQKTFELRAPAPPVNIVCDPSLGPDRLSLVWDAPGGATDIDRYQVYRSATTGGPYELVSVDPVRHTLMLDRGLYPTTPYYYRLSSVDISGNESALSAEAIGSTNPAQVEGWPITMPTETVSSPVVGDIDGDHDFELVQGNNKIHAWHHNGVEVRDADGNAQTWGLFSTLGNSFVSHIALSEVDNTPGLDILAASRDTRQVFAFNYTGNVITGWPKPVTNAIRAGMVAGDIDGDGDREVIALDERGVLYVWHRDGTEYRNGDNNPSTNGVFRTFGNCFFQYTCPAIGDIDGDTIDDIVVGTQGDSVFVLRANGSSVPGWPKAFSSDIGGSPAIGDIDNNGSLDVVVHEMIGNTWAFNGDGTQMWFRWAQNNLSFSPSPALGDLDNDGKLEVVIPSKDRKVYAIRWNGTDLPGWPVFYATSQWTESSPIIADVDNDGSLDVILGNENKFITGWDAAGQPLPGFPLAMSDAVRATPAIADLDKDGDVEVIAAGWDKTVRVWDFPGMFNPQKAPWAKYHANLYNDGNVSTQLPTPVGGATFIFSLKADRVELAWTIPAEAGASFDIERSEVVAGVASPYRRIAGSVHTSPDGVVRLTERDIEMGARYAYRLIGEDGDVVHETTSIYVPVARAALGQNFPNPFNPSTRFDYWVPERAGSGGTPVRIVIYDVHGARVRTVVDASQPAGRYRVEWDGRNGDGMPVGSGIYFYRMVAAQFSDTKKMLLLK